MRSEELFSQLLDDAAKLPEHLRQLALGRAQPPPGVPPSPLHMVSVLEPWFRAQYLAGLTLLRDPEVSPAADLVLRGLAELFAAVAWIFEGGPVAFRECRAICYTLGVTRAMQDVLRGRPGPDAETARRLNELNDLEKEILKQRQEEGCRCGPWRYSKVGAALKELSKKHQDLSWAYESWLWASTVMHHSIPLVPAPDEPAELPAPMLFERGIQLWRFIHLLVNFGIILLQLEHPSNLQGWRELASGLVQQPVFKDAVGGQLE